MFRKYENDQKSICNEQDFEDIHLEFFDTHYEEQRSLEKLLKSLITYKDLTQIAKAVNLQIISKSDSDSFIRKIAKLAEDFQFEIDNSSHSDGIHSNSDLKVILLFMVKITSLLAEDIPVMALISGKAFTILSASNITFSGMDLSGIWAFHSDLTGAIFHNTILVDAKLKNIKLHGAYLNSAILYNTSFTDVNLGEIPHLMHELVECLAFSPNNQYLASGNQEGELCIWTRINYQLLYRISAYSKSVSHLSFNSQSRFLASCSRSEEIITIWDIESAKKIINITNLSPTFLEFNPARAFELAFSNKNNLIILNIETHDFLVPPKIPSKTESWISCISYHPNGETLVLSKGNSLEEWELISFTQKNKYIETVCPRTSFLNVCYHNFKCFIIANDGERIMFFDSSLSSCFKTFSTGMNARNGLTLHPQMEFLAAAGDREIKLWKMEEIGEIKQFQQWDDHTFRIMALHFSPDGLLASGSYDDTIKLRYIESTTMPKESNQKNGHNDRVNNLCFNEQGNLCISSGADGRNKIWQAKSESWEYFHEWQNDGDIRALSLIPTYGFLALLLERGFVRKDDNRVELWSIDFNFQTLPRYIKTLPKDHEIQDISVSHDHQYLAGIGWYDSKDLHKTSKNVIYIWKVESGICKHKVETEIHAGLCLKFSPIDNRLAVTSAKTDNTIYLYKADDFLIKMFPTLRRHANTVTSLCFSTEGSILASGDVDSVVCVWSMLSFSITHFLPGHGGPIRSLVFFSPEFYLLASGNDEGKICVWNLALSSCQNILKGHIHSVTALAFNPVYNYLVSGSRDKSIMVWHKLQKKTEWQLLWRTHDFLHCEDCKFDEVIKADAITRNVLLQRNNKIDISDFKKISPLNIIDGEGAVELKIICLDSEIDCDFVSRQSTSVNLVNSIKELPGQPSSVGSQIFDTMHSSFLHRLFLHNEACKAHVEGVRDNNAVLISKAEDLFKTACEINPESSVIVRYANFLYQQGRFQETIKILEKVIEEPDFDVYCKLGYDINDVIVAPPFVIEKIYLNESQKIVISAFLLSCYLLLLCYKETGVKYSERISFVISKFFSQDDDQLEDVNIRLLNHIFEIYNSEETKLSYLNFEDSQEENLFSNSFHYQMATNFGEPYADEQDEIKRVKSHLSLFKGTIRQRFVDPRLVLSRSPNSLWNELNTDYLIEHRHDNPEMQKHFDSRFGPIKK